MATSPLSNQSSAEKRCSRCRETKPVAAFNRDRNSRDGFQRYCVACMATYKRKVWRPANGPAVERDRASSRAAKARRRATA